MEMNDKRRVYFGLDIVGAAFDKLHMYANGCILIQGSLRLVVCL